jgi:TPR repeat protein
MVSSREQLEIGITAFDQCQYAKAFEVLMPFAEQGVSDAQAIIGNFYHIGLGGIVPVNGSEAVRLYNKAAEGGCAVSYWNLGTVYAVGMPGVPPDPEQARFCKRKAVELGFDMAPTGWDDE